MNPVNEVTDLTIAIKYVYNIMKGKLSSAIQNPLVFVLAL